MALPWRSSRAIVTPIAALPASVTSRPARSHPATAAPSSRPFTTQTLLAQPVQIYRSTSTDPYLNLSIEHHLLQRSHPDSTVLFLCTNRPSVVIGRNQNPWLEVNLHLLRRGLPPLSPSQAETQTQTRENVPVSLVRRRSGGGTVFHDGGNMNWTVICPPAVFDRDRHAEMVARALRRLGVGRARVNERHDIVVDASDDHDPSPSSSSSSYSSSSAPDETTAPLTPRRLRCCFKVSGSAYKLTRTRSLHHGTCLLASPYLGRISALLRSPAEGFIRARGVESVRSRIRNVGLGAAEFADAVVDEFRAMYGGGDGSVVVVGEEEALATEDVVRGVRELTSPDWIFGQTPQFTFSTHPTEDDPRERPPSVHQLPPGFSAHLTIRHGEIQSASLGKPRHSGEGDGEGAHEALVGQRLHDMADWREALRQANLSDADASVAGEWLNHQFGIQTPGEEGISSSSSGSVAQTVTETIANTLVGSFLSRR